MKKVYPLAIVRALAATFIILHHSELASEYLRGGMNILLFLSGISFATLVIRSSLSETVSSMWGFVRELIFISVVLEIVAIVIKRKFDLVEFLMIGNWFHYTQVSIFPIWYVQLLWQLLAFFGITFALFNIPERFHRRPVLVSSVYLISCVVFDVIGQLAWNTDDRGDRLPWVYAWTFVLGWLYWAIMVRAEPTKMQRWIMTLVAVCTSVLLHWNSVIVGPGEETASRAVYFLLAFLFLIWGRPFKVSAAIENVVRVVSQASLFIFLFHISFMRITNVLISRAGVIEVDGVAAASLRVCAGLAGPILMWGLYTAWVRTNDHFQVTERLWRKLLGALPNAIRQGSVNPT